MRTGIPPNQKQYRLVRDVLFSAVQTARPAQIESLLEGKAGELPTGQTLQFENGALAYTVSYSVPIQQSQFGMAEVVVDSPDFEKIRPSVEQAVESVRAAGIYMTVSGAKQVKTDGVFRIEKSAQLKLTPDETIGFEEKNTATAQSCDAAV